MKSNGLLYEANEALYDLKRKHTRMTQQLDSLKKYEDWSLSMEGKKVPEHTYYDLVRKGSAKKLYLGNENNEQVLNVKRHRYAQKALSVLSDDIRLINSLLDEYKIPDYETINSLLPVTYQTNLQTSVPGKIAMPKEALEWIRQMEAEKAKYPLYKPEQLKHPAMDGVMKRSKSEVIISNMLFQAGIPYVYEVPLFINGEMLLPDFRILSLIDLATVIIIEHQGMVFIDEYANKFIKSTRLYLQSDWIPNKNLFFTYDDANETLNPEQILSILRKFIDPSI